MNEEMSDEGKQSEVVELVIRRILVALDTSMHSLAALQAAAALAATVEAELIGLFVEDVNLLRLASLPFSQEVRLPTAAGHDLDPERMERELRLRASQARRALVHAAEQAETTWTFRVVRGQVSAEVLTAARDADLLSLGRVSRPLGGRKGLGSTARAAAVEGTQTVLLGHTKAQTDRPLLVTYDGSEPSAKALAVAARMAQIYEANLIVLIIAADPDAAPALAERASAWLDSRISHAEYRYLPPGNGDALVESAGADRCGLVILGGDNDLLQGERLQELLDRLDCPTMVVR